MANTHTLPQTRGVIRSTIEFPVDLWEQIEALAGKLEISKKRVILEACSVHAAKQLDKLAKKEN